MSHSPLKPNISLSDLHPYEPIDNSINFHKEKNSFQQISDYMEARIRRGDWQAHEKLPSVRQLSQESGMHRLTVLKAYQQLKESGILYSRHKSGYYVSPPAAGTLTHDSELEPSLFQGNMGELRHLPARYQFSHALIDPNLLPNHYFAEYMKKVFDLYPKLLGTYAHIQGDMELREMLARYFGRTASFHIDPEELLITSGAQQGIYIVAETWIRPGDHVLIESPTYATALDVFRQKGARLLPVGIHSGGYDMQDIEQKMQQYRPRIFYLNPTFHNPTGLCIPAEQRKQLVDLAVEYQCLLIEDDTCSDIYFDRKPPAPIFAYDTEGYTIHIRSFSKYISPGLRIACIAARKPWMSRLLTAKSLADGGTPLLNQKLFLHYFMSDRLHRHLDKLRIALRIRMEIMQEELDRAGWQYEQPQGGLSLWVRVPEHLSVPHLLRECLARQISFVPGSLFDAAEQSGQYIRLSFSFASETQIRDGMRELLSISRDINVQRSSIKR
ncbi:aminotransferase-like domain-containing protein [Paenibacillus wulumuqiensis]|uniref:aminotransferase-like domain-containing protein n=1 Tax=Paenibacillus wulumuqiensis TaxID=1567107 RepID=UPI000619BF55|nr:PLP-dependent aminotransferase family protein [Paenibacillus wulumuqiensis]